MKPIVVIPRYTAVQFDPLVKPWPADVAETWAEPPPHDEPNESTLHRYRRAQADREVMDLHKAGCTYYFWDNVVGHAHPMYPGSWLVRRGDDGRVDVYSDEAFQKAFVRT